MIRLATACPVLARFLEMEDDDWHDQIDVNLTDRCNAIRAIVPYVVRDGGGRIIVTASTQGRRGTKFGADRTSSRLKLIQRLVRLNLSMRPLPA